MSKPQIGAAVWFTAWDGDRLPAIVVGHGEKNGRPLVDLEIEGASGLDRNRWGYFDQITPR